MKKIILSLILITIFNSCTSGKPYTDAMKLELKSMYQNDQHLQDYDLKKVVRKEYSDSLKNEFDMACKKNLVVVKKYFTDYGFPGIKKNGKETGLYFWVIVQHGDHDVTFQEKILFEMKKNLDKKNADSRNYAYLYDRVKKNQNKPQLFGTQIIWNNEGIHSVYNLEEPEKVNERRNKMGLETIEEYLKKFVN